MFCPYCSANWADFPVDISKAKMTKEQEAERLKVFNSNEHQTCPDCQKEFYDDSIKKSESIDKFEVDKKPDKEKKVEKKINSKFCSECGQQYIENEKFCTKCGIKRR